MELPQRASVSEDHENPEDEVALLLTFLRERDASCPLCGYNLRNLVRPQCPECQEDLILAVGVRKLRFGLFLATITPGLFSGIAAPLLLIPIIAVPLTGVVLRLGSSWPRMHSAGSAELQRWF